MKGGKGGLTAANEIIQTAPHSAEGDLQSPDTVLDIIDRIEDRALRYKREEAR